MPVLLFRALERRLDVRNALVALARQAHRGVALWRSESGVRAVLQEYGHDPAVTPAGSEHQCGPRISSSHPRPKNACIWKDPAQEKGIDAGDEVQLSSVGERGEAVETRIRVSAGGKERLYHLDVA